MGKISFFFITRIEAYKTSGHTIDQTLAFFESERGVRSVNQFHKALQEKKPLKRVADAVQDMTSVLS